MQRVSEVMTRDIRSVTPQENLQRAAQLMDELDVGALPVCDEERLVGMVTDRDITVRGTAAGSSPRDAHVEDVMSPDVRWCFEDDSMDEVMSRMADSKIRRIPVLSHDEQQKLVGIVTLGDIVTKTGSSLERDAEQLVESVSSPSGPTQPGDAGASAAPGAESAEVAKTPIGLRPVTGTDSGSASVPSGGVDGTGTTGLSGSGTAGGTSAKGEQDRQ
ncbi:MAG TPA: CBS domain-containing protein [Noviherbaspirillum sp.]|nr:CBS domain-containing protein [Noviherbaspirillum sp.]